MQVAVRTPLISFLTWDHSQDRLAIIPMPDAVAPPANATGMHHAAFSVASLRELCDQYRSLKAQGIVPLRAFNHGVATSMYYADPDGNEIELTVEAFASVEALNEWFATGAFDVNPVGVLIDPDELSARIDADEPELEILKPHPDHLTWLQEHVEGRHTDVTTPAAAQAAKMVEQRDKITSAGANRWPHPSPAPTRSTEKGERCG